MNRDLIVPIQSRILTSHLRAIARASIEMVDNFVPSPTQTDQSLTEAAVAVSSNDAETSKQSFRMVDGSAVPAPISGLAIPQSLSGGAAVTASVFPGLVMSKGRYAPFDRFTGAKLGCTQCNQRRLACNLETPCNHCVADAVAGDPKSAECRYTYKLPFGKRHKQPRIAHYYDSYWSKCTLCNANGDKNCNGKMPCNRCLRKGEEIAKACFIPRPNMVQPTTSEPASSEVRGCTRCIRWRKKCNKQIPCNHCREKGDKESSDCHFPSRPPFEHKISEPQTTLDPPISRSSLPTANMVSDTEAVISYNKPAVNMNDETFAAMLRTEIERMDNERYTGHDSKSSLNPLLGQSTAPISFPTSALRSTATDNMDVDTRSNDSLGYGSIYDTHDHETSGPYFYKE